MADWKVTVPPGEVGRAKVDHVEVKNDFYGLIHGRHCPDGTYTRLLIGGALWMSDTPAEQRDHYVAASEMRKRGGRVLIMGLGLGMVVQQALSFENVEHVDVVESDADVIALVGPHYEGPRCTIHKADAFEIKWPVGTRWTVVWHDIWLNMSEENLPEMARLKRSYGQRCDWQGAWGQETILADRRSSYRRY